MSIHASVTTLALSLLAFVGNAQVASIPQESTAPKATALAAKSSNGANAANAKDVAKPAASVAPQRGGAVVFIDPTTGKIVQPTAGQIGTITGPVTNSSQQVAPAPPQMIQGQGGVVGMKLGPESQAYAVATRGADGQLVMDCVTGDEVAKSHVDAAAAVKDGVKDNAPKQTAKDPARDQ